MSEANWLCDLEKMQRQTLHSFGKHWAGVADTLGFNIYSTDIFGYTVQYFMTMGTSVLAPRCSIQFSL